MIDLKDERKGNIYKLKYEFPVNHFDFKYFKVKFINLLLGTFLYICKSYASQKSCEETVHFLVKHALEMKV